MFLVTPLLVDTRRKIIISIMSSSDHTLAGQAQRCQVRLNFIISHRKMISDSFASQSYSFKGYEWGCFNNNSDSVLYVTQSDTHFIIPTKESHMVTCLLRHVLRPTITTADQAWLSLWWWLIVIYGSNNEVLSSMSEAWF